MLSFFKQKDNDSFDFFVLKGKPKKEIALICKENKNRHHISQGSGSGLLPEEHIPQCCVVGRGPADLHTQAHICQAR